MTDSERPDSELTRALDVALARALTPPRVPVQFRTKLQAALVRAAGSNISDMRSRLEREQREQLAALEQNYVRLRRRTLGTMIGAAFAAGAAVAVALPWVTATLGPVAPLLIASTGAAIGIGVGLTSWLASRRAFDSEVV